MRFPSHRPGRSYLPGQYLAKVHIMQSILLKEGQAACLEVGGYLVEPRSSNMEENLEEIAEVNIDIFIASVLEISTESILQRVFLLLTKYLCHLFPSNASVPLSRFCTTLLLLVGPGGSAFPSKKVKVMKSNGFGRPTMPHLAMIHPGQKGR